MNYPLLNRRAAGFTLVELLVVITIVIVLAAVSFTGFRAMRQSAHGTTSASNMRQLGVAIQTYVAEKNRYPSTGDINGDEFQVAWDRIMMPYLGNPDFDFKPAKHKPILKNSPEAAAMGPAAKLLYCPGDEAKVASGEMARSYAMCSWTCTQGGPGFHNGFNNMRDRPGHGPPPSLIPDPARAVVLVEHQSEKGRVANIIGTGNYEYMFGFMKQPQRSGPANYHKNNTQLLLFVDGHVAPCAGDISQEEWERKGYSPHIKRF